MTKPCESNAHAAQIQPNLREHDQIVGPAFVYTTAKTWTLNNNKQTTITLNATPAQDLASDERVRQSLSRLGQVPLQRYSSPSSSGPSPRHRFVRDGEVPTVYTSRNNEPVKSSEPAEAITAVRAEVSRERAARTEAESALEDARTMTRSLQTRLGHMELELQEARARADRTESELRVAREAIPAKPVRTRQPSPITATEVSDEPEPVKWWLKS